MLPRPLPRYLRIVLVLFTFLIAMPPGQSVAGGLAVSPQRLEFEGRTRSAEVQLRTNSPEAQTYRLSLVEMDMPEEGPLEMVENPAPDRKSARRLIRYSPRQVTLRPGETQVIRVRVRKPGGLADGEYRSHLLFQNVPDVGEGIEAEADQNPARGTQVSIVPIFGVAIPVTVRHGELSAEASLSELRLTTGSGASAGTKTLSLTIGRSGNRSLHGDLRVFLQQRNGAPVEVGRLNGISVYTPGTRRHVDLQLTAPPGGVLSRGTLSVEYRAKASEGGELLASSRMSLDGI